MTRMATRVSSLSLSFSCHCCLPFPLLSSQLHTQSTPFGLCPKGLMLTQAPSSIMRSRNSRDHTMNSGGSCLSASTMAIPTINDSSAAMSACSTISARPASSLDNQMHSPKKQERVKKRVIWGIEVAEELHWKGWELGKETTRSLVLKNRSLKLQKMKYRYQYKESRTQRHSLEPLRQALLKNKTNKKPLTCHIKASECLKRAV
ncbi:cilia- and flagella-associated protein 65 isoform X9 [Cebus imitator]|uniref:cilia- and flagella-associated protein 65 isoform X9 n=1 Tax=Cebus imitator TaxID=2715852 RepID=UPI0018993AEA|nr:cilia- and flagella-associated protein 65 isoform X9 [Cebus imitator]